MHRVLSFGVVMVVAIAGLTGCSDTGRSMIISAVNDDLKPHEAVGTAVVDMDTLIPGNWTQLTIVCTGGTRAELDSALGFRWEESSIVEQRDFFAMMVFSSSVAVESYLSVGQNDFFEDWYFTPCPGGDEWSSVVSNPIVVPRAESTIEFNFNGALPDYPRWYVPLAELNELDAKDG